jgi:hypothetical protein
MSAALPNGQGAPVFVVGMPRSGTTLLSTILASHSDLAITPETHFLRQVQAYRRDPQPGSWDRLVSRLLSSVELRDFALPDQVARCLEERLRALEPSNPFEALGHLGRAFADQSGKPRWGEKTPAHLEAVPELATAFAGAHFICLVRDPRDVALSLYRMPWKLGADPIATFLRWRQYIRLAWHYQQELSSRFTLLRYEDLLSSSDEVVRALCAKLGLGFEEAMLRVEEAKPSTFNPAREPWKADCTSALDPSKAGAWRTAMPPVDKATAELLLAPEMRVLGYPCISHELSARTRLTAGCRVVYARLHGVMARVGWCTTR